MGCRLPLGACILVDGERACHFLVGHVLEVVEFRLRDHAELLKACTEGLEALTELAIRNPVCLAENLRVCIDVTLKREGYLLAFSPFCYGTTAPHGMAKRRCIYM